MKANDKAYQAALNAFYMTRAEAEHEPNIVCMRRAVDAAYAAQFQSEEYAGLVRELRMRPHRRGYETEDEAKERRQKEREEAADAIEALLAERDDFAEQLALRSESGMAKDMQEIMRINNELVAERDALAARLALVEDDALVKIAAKAQWKHAWQDAGGTEEDAILISGDDWHQFIEPTRAAIAAIRPHIEADIADKFINPTPEMIAAAWAVFKRDKHKSIGPGPGFVEAMKAMAAAAIRRGK